MTESSYRLAYLKSKKELKFCLEQMPRVPPFAYTFEFDLFGEVALWAQPSIEQDMTLTLTVESSSQMKHYLDNELLLALLILSSRLSIKRKLEAMRPEIDNIFEAIGVKLKWGREKDCLVANLDRVLMSNEDLMNFQEVYYQRKSEINVETVGAVKQFNAYNHVKDLSVQLLESVLQEKNPTQKYDEMIEDLRLKYLQLSATQRIRTSNRRFSFERLEQEIHARLVESLRRPVVTVESESARTETCLDIGQLFQIKFSEIDERVMMDKQFHVHEFKEAINCFVKDVATDLRSQENLIILMEFLLAKTFNFFDVKESMRALPSLEETNGKDSSVRYTSEEQEGFRKQLVQLRRTHKQLIRDSRSHISKLDGRIWQLEKELMNSHVKFDALLKRKDNELKDATTKIEKLEDEIKSLSKASTNKQSEQQKMLSQLTQQLEKIRLTGSMSTPDDRELIGKTSAPSRSPATLKSSVSTAYKRPLQSRHTASMKQLPASTLSNTNLNNFDSTTKPKNAAETLKPNEVKPESKPKTFFKKNEANAQLVRSPRGVPEATKKGPPVLKKSQQSATLINNINAIFTYVKEQSKNISQRVTVKGKENAPATTIKK